MRSRYSAYALQDDAYLFTTWHSSTRPTRKALKALSPIEWLSLKILRTELGSVNSDTGVVEFVATYAADGQVEQLHEVSRFSREKRAWRYLEALLR
jgi:SEC-C motif-containing protein